MTDDEYRAEIERLNERIAILEERNASLDMMCSKKQEIINNLSEHFDRFMAKPEE